jgi:hypothetical protein
MSNFAKDHSEGKHQEEIVALIKQIDPHLNGHPRAIIILALTRILAAMLAPANKATREEMLQAIPDTIRNILREMDRLIRNSG